MKNLEKKILGISLSVIPLTFFIIGNLSKNQYINNSFIKKYEDILIFSGITIYYTIITSSLFFLEYLNKKQKI